MSKVDPNLLNLRLSHARVRLSFGFFRLDAILIWTSLLAVFNQLYARLAQSLADMVRVSVSIAGEQVSECKLLKAG